MKKFYSFSEARQKFAAVLEEAEREGEVRVRRRNGTVFVIRPEKKKGSPFDVPGVDLGIGREDLVAAIQEGREHDYPSGDQT